MSPAKHWPKKKKQSSSTARPEPSPGRAPVNLTDRSVKRGGPVDVVRRDKSFDHLPLPPGSGSKRCALHSYVLNEEYKSSISYCPGCKLHLCVHCYSKFHSIEDIVSSKDELKAELPRKKSRQSWTAARREKSSSAKKQKLHK